jgi:hypothetical protein
MGFYAFDAIERVWCCSNRRGFVGARRVRVMVTRANVIIALQIARELSLKARDGCLHTHKEVPT